MTSFPYGFGRRYVIPIVLDPWAEPIGVIHRVCPGQHVANKSLYINLALLLWSFHIVERADTPIDTTGHTDGVIAHVAPFHVEFIPRIEEGRLKQMISEL